jgi:hypothetical protein
LVWLAGHDAAHEPPEHAGAVAAQAAPHAPQFFGSLAMNVQIPLQRAPPFAHAHTPNTQAVPAEQSVSQAPQFALSFPTSTQALPQSIIPAGHSLHAPLTQPCPAGQIFPHAPQLSALVVMSSQPLGEPGQ